MLAVHWSPVNKSTNIANNGIRKERNGVYCFPVTGHRALDRWWMKALKRFRKDGKKYNGFIFRVEEKDLPAYFGHWIGHTSSDRFEKPIHSLAELGQAIRDTIIWRIGERVHWDAAGLPHGEADCLRLGREEIGKDSKVFKDTLSDQAFMEYILEDYQLVLSQSIKANRIVRIIAPEAEFGRFMYKNI